MTTRRTALGLISATAAAGAFPTVTAAAGPLKLSIRVTQSPLMVAPAAVFLEAVIEAPASVRSVHGRFASQYLPAFHEFHYAWSLPDAGPVRAPAHLVDAHRRTDRAEGPFVTRVFTTPGQHRVAVDVLTQDGQRARAETVVEVSDPDEVFGRGGTIVVSANGDFAGAPPHDPKARARTLEAAMALYKRMQAPQVRVLLRRGQNHSPPGKALTFKRQGAHCHIGTWGTGAPPLIDMRATGGNFITITKAWDSRELAVSGLDFVGGWDPTTELWQGAEHKSIVRLESQSTLLLQDCRERGCAATVNVRRVKAPRPGGTMVVLDEYSKTDFKDYLLLCPRTQADVAITGCKVVQNLRALNGAQARDKTAEATYGRNSHNFFRGGGRRLYVASNDIFVRHGWSSGVLYDNHALRLNRHDARGMRAVVARNHIEGMITRRSKGGAVPMNMLIEQNYIVANPMTRPALSFHGGAASIRNNIVVEHATARQPRGGAGFRSFVSFDWDGTVRATGQMPFLIHHNSFILLRKNAAPEIVFQKDNPLPHVLIGNNLVWAEHMGDPEGVWPLDTTSLGWDARYRGARLGWAGLRDQTLPRTLRAGDAVIVPYWTDMLGWDLSQTDFAGEAGRHVIEVAIGGKRAKFDAQRGEAQFAFLPDGVRITNRSGRPWPKGAGFRLHCDRGTTPSPMQTAYGHPPGTLSLYRPQPGSSAWQSGDSAMWWPHDFLGRIRPSAASKGAVEPS